jgi:hypoxanthine phosphoribosyltransferase
LAAYTPQGDLIQLSWDDVMEICRDLAMTVSKEFDPDIVVGVARGGLIPATIIASILRKDLYPVALSRRVRGVIVREKPDILVPVSDEVDGRRVLIVDERSETGETLRLAVRETQKKGAKKVKTAAIFARPGSWKPNYFGFESEAVVIQPWDYELIVSGRFVVNPDYEEMLYARS